MHLRLQSTRSILLAVLAAYAIALVYTTHVTGLHGDVGWSMFDDGMISMRYARNLAAGNGLVWNAGQYIEGFTNPIWTLLGALAIEWTSTDLAPLVMQIIGTSFLLSTVYCTMRLAQGLNMLQCIDDQGSRSVSDIVVSVFFVAWYPSTYWSIMGMEVSSCLALAALSGNIWISGMRATPKAALLFALTGLAWLVRPDASLIVLPFLASALTDAESWKHPERRRMLISALCLALFFVVASILRYRYYGQLTPNTYTLKVTGYDFAQRLANGFGYIGLFLEGYGPLVAGFVALGALSRLGIRTAAPFIGLPLILIAYQTYVGGDPWVYWRQLTPSIVPIAAIAASSVAAATARPPALRLARWRNGATHACLALCVLGFVSGDRNFWKEMLFVEPPYTVRDNEINFRTAQALNQVLDPDALVLSFWAGTIPYYRFGPSLDPLGKTDRFIAELAAHRSPSWNGMTGVPGHSKYDLKHSIIDAKPDYIQYAFWGDETSVRPDVTRQVHEDYVGVEFEGIPLCLRRGSAKVKWDMVRVTGSCPSDSSQPS